MRNARPDNGINLTCATVRSTETARVYASYIYTYQHIFHGQNGLPDRLHQALDL